PTGQTEHPEQRRADQHQHGEHSPPSAFPGVKGARSIPGGTLLASTGHGPIRRRIWRNRCEFDSAGKESAYCAVAMLRTERRIASRDAAPRVTMAPRGVTLSTLIGG